VKNKKNNLFKRKRKLHLSMGALFVHSYPVKWNDLGSHHVIVDVENFHCWGGAFGTLLGLLGFRLPTPGLGRWPLPRHGQKGGCKEEQVTLLSKMQGVIQK